MFTRVFDLAEKERFEFSTTPYFTSKTHILTTF